MSRLTRNTPRRDWLFGRIRVEEIMEAAGDTATPPLREQGPHLGLTTGPLQSRRTTRLPAPAPRIRPADLEAESEGRELYGARAIVPWPYQEKSVAGAGDAGIAATIASYAVPDFAGSARVTVRVARAAAAGALVAELQLVRAGRTYKLWSLANVDLETAEPLVLLRGDELRVAITTTGTAGVELAALLSIQERV